MRAALCTAWGNATHLAIEDLPEPPLADGAVRIAVRAAGVNFADTLIVQGKYQLKPEFPFSPGLEVSGEVIETAPGVTRCKTGDRVMAALDFGGYASQAVVPADSVYVLPDGLDWPEAAGFPVTYGTAHVGLDARGNLRDGEVLLVHGAGGGVGLNAVEVGKAMGAEVIATAGSTAKLDLAREHGADHVIDYSSEDIRERVKALTDGRGADVVFDPVGGDTFDASLRAIAWGGRLIIVGFAGGRIQEIPANYLLVKHCSAIGLYWGSYKQHAPEVLDRSYAALFDMFTAGKLKPHVSRTFALEDVAAAHDFLLARKSTGKVVLTIDNGG